MGNTTGREYLRVSFDRSGKEKSQGEQHDENVAAASSLGITSFGKPYNDTGSASRHARRTTTRDDFDRLSADLESGHFAADVLVMWESSRGSRKVGEWDALLDACEAAQVSIMVTTHHRVYDPSNPRDRRSLLEDAVDSAYESDKTSMRVKRSMAKLAADGHPHGVTPFGYLRTYHPLTREFVSQDEHPDEAPIVKELFERLASGESLTAIARDFEQRGVRSRGTEKRPGRPFAAQMLRQMALSPVYAGQRVHSPIERGRAHSDGPVTIYDAKWPPLIDDATFYAVRTRLLDPARSTTRPGSGKWLLSVMTRCDVCGGPLAVKFPAWAKKARRYICQAKGCVNIDADALDAWAEDKVLDVLSRPDNIKRLVPPNDAPALAAARDVAARVRAEHQDLVRRVGAGELSPTLAAGAEPGILARLSEAETEVQRLLVPTGLSTLIQPGPKVRQQWAAMPMSSKRETARLLFSKGVLGVLSIAGATKRSEPVRARVRLDGLIDKV